jgi:hypothetical protein
MENTVVMKSLYSSCSKEKIVFSFQQLFSGMVCERSIMMTLVDFVDCKVKGSGMEDGYLDNLQETDHGKRGGGEGDDESDTDNDDDKTLTMSVDGEDGLATQPEDDDDSKCAMACVGDTATDHSSIKFEDY